MPPHFTNPPPSTESARTAASAFFCTLCNKGYARANEFAAHESSYEHNHNQRRKDLKAMNTAMSKQQQSSKKDSAGGPLGAIKPISLSGVKNSGGGGGAGGGKKPGFKSAFGSVKKAAAADEDKAKASTKSEDGGKNEGGTDVEMKDADGSVKAGAAADQHDDGEGSTASDTDTDDETFAADAYNPRFPSGCAPGRCPLWHVDGVGGGGGGGGGRDGKD